jgi:hypothetical protein
VIGDGERAKSVPVDWWRGSKRAAVRMDCRERAFERRSLVVIVVTRQVRAGKSMIENNHPIKDAEGSSAGPVQSRPRLRLRGRRYDNPVADQ